MSLAGNVTARRLERINSRSDASSSSSAYFSWRALLASVESGSVAPLRGSFIIKLYRSGGNQRIARRQDLPIEAFWTSAELHDVVSKLEASGAAPAEIGAIFVALSYCWLGEHEPDGERFHLRYVATMADAYVQHLHSKIFATLAPLQADFALFWDFAVLFQSPRSPREEELFKQGLRASNLWYGHAYTNTWVQPRLPPTPPIRSLYKQSGWCFIEASLSAVLKPPSRRLDISKFSEVTRRVRGYAGIVTECTARGTHPPPLLPETILLLLKNEKRFTNGSDVQVVAQLYKSFFDAVTPKQETLMLSHVGWGEPEVLQLAEALPHFLSLISIDLSDNGLDDAAIGALAEALAFSTRSVQELDISKSRGTDAGLGFMGRLLLQSDTSQLCACRCDAFHMPVEAEQLQLDKWQDMPVGTAGEGAFTLLAALVGASRLTELQCHSMPIGESTCVAMALSLERPQVTLSRLSLVGCGLNARAAGALLKGTKSSVTELNLKSNKIKDEGISAICEALQSSKDSKLASLYVNDNEIGSKGAQSVAAMAAVVASLTEVC